MALSSLEDLQALIGSSFNEENIYGSADAQLDCLLPSGIYIPLSVNRWATVAEVKEKLWAEAATYPLFKALQSSDNYVFVYINSFGEREEISAESRQISTLQPFLSVLKIIRKEKRDRENHLSSQIGALIGKHDFDSLRDEEVIAFRKESKARCVKWNEEKSSVRDLGKLISFLHPPDVSDDVELWQRVCDALTEQGNKFMIEIPHEQSTGNCGTHRLVVAADRYSDDVINSALRKQNQANLSNEGYDVDDYVLKVVGREEYLLPDADNKPRPLYKYTYIYRKIMKQEPPRLTVVKKSDITKPVPRRRGSGVVEPRVANTLRPTKKEVRHADLWQIGDKFSFKVVGANKVNCEGDSMCILKAAIYHGVETICDMQDTCEIPVVDGTVEFNETLAFDLAVCDLPRMARLCLSLYIHTSKPGRPAKKATIKTGNKATRKRKKSVADMLNDPLTEHGKDYVPMAWVNMCLFDFKARLTVGHVTLHMWPYDESTILSDSNTNHLGTVVNNPQTESSIALLLKFSHWGHKNMPIAYPPLEKILQCAADKRGSERAYGLVGHFEMSEDDAAIQLSELLDNRDPLQSFHEQEKEQIWAMREDISSNYRDSLPKLLSCVRWDSHPHVALMRALLQAWPDVSVDTALELLDCMYPDESVRRFAVSCLRKSISDTELCRYLLQLVQALKFESYLGCELVYFLLERAIKNRKLGHYLFWLLKSEMHIASVSVRFGLILEAYCLGSADHVTMLRNQEDMVGKLLAINRLVKSCSVREEGLAAMKEILTSYQQSESFEVVSSPLHPALRLSTLMVDECKFMGSARKPLWLVWKNGDKFGDDIKIIFKNGDDLRQDMLTLQVLHIMDSIWMSQGLDLRLNPYDCLSTGRDVGMLEVVQESDTVANIQLKYAAVSIASPFSRDSLYKWLQEKNPNPKDLQKAVNEFTLSCAGYSVASYVLGIGDRHSDNIMLKKSGPIFHIDFGHFLGNFKSKYGIKRERVPFVLTHDFIHIIKKNTLSKNNRAPFDEFKYLCEEAFMLLRKRGNLLISLFMMMLSTGLPELRAVSDLKYLQDTLKLDLPDPKALKHFRSQFKLALKDSWTVSVNFAFHNYVHA